MSHMRDLIRTKKRLPLEFGTDGTVCRKAFTEDISPMGMFIKTANVSNPNTLIRIEILHRDQPISFDARVMWAKRVPQNLFHLVKKSGMGVRIVKFHSGREAYCDLCQSMYQN